MASKTNDGIFRILGFVIFLGGLIYIFSHVYWAISFTNNCTGYLERAAGASSVDIAMEEIQKAITFLEENELTHGNTGVFYESPENDIEFWYKNLKSSYSELSEISDSATQLEKTNVLMKLKETVGMTRTEEGSNVVSHPSGISRFPNFRFHAIMLYVAIGLVFISGLYVFFEH